MPDWGALISLVLASVAVMGSPGPSTVSTTAVGASFGVRRALPYVAGLALGTIGVLLIVATGLTTLLLSLPLLASVLLAGALLYVIYLAWRIATAPPLARIDTAATAPGIASGLALGIANPKAYLAIAAVFAANRLAGDATADALAKTVVLIVMIVAIHGAWLFAGALIAGTLHDPVRSRVVNVVLAVALVVFSALALLPHA